ncbi:hypothetical protein ABPG74_011321 [Tetrahymena malaccensis]
MSILRFNYINGKYQSGTARDNCVACSTVTSGACPATCVSTGHWLCLCSPKSVTDFVCSITYNDGTACVTPVNSKYQSGTAGNNCVAYRTKISVTCPAVCVRTGAFNDGKTTGCTCISLKNFANYFCQLYSNSITVVFGALLVFSNLLI